MEKYSINVHFDMVCDVEVYACSEEEALDKAEELAGSKDARTFDCVGTESCITDVEHFVMIEDEKEAILTEVKENSNIEHTDEQIKKAIDQLYEEEDNDLEPYSLEEIVWFVKEILSRK